jgi:hypothetical protein
VALAVKELACVCAVAQLLYGLLKCQHTSAAYVSSIRQQHTSAYVSSIRQQHTSAAYVSSIRQHTSAYVRI